MWKSRLRRAANKATKGRVGMHSTAKHYSSGPSAKVIGYFQYNGATRLRCPSCGWSGAAADGDRKVFDELFDVRCPNCEKMLLVVSYPTVEEIRRAAASGNQAATDWLSRMENG
jgi:DNA-directed RNA polymerase subunit RPC12/RpoP